MSAGSEKRGDESARSDVPTRPERHEIAEALGADVAIPVASDADGLATYEQRQAEARRVIRLDELERLLSEDWDVSADERATINAAADEITRLRTEVARLSAAADVLLTTKIISAEAPKSYVDGTTEDGVVTAWLQGRVYARNKLRDALAADPVQQQPEAPEGAMTPFGRATNQFVAEWDDEGRLNARFEPLTPTEQPGAES